MSILYASNSNEINDRERRNMNRSRKIASDGMVLLANDGILPLSPLSKPLALFGSGARRTVKGGTGSGDVNSRTVYNVEQGLEDAGFTIGTKAWLNQFDSDCNDALNAFGKHFQETVQEKGWAGVNEALINPYRDPVVPDISKKDLEGTDSYCAIYVIGRTSGEGSDRKLSGGDYQLSEKEISNLLFLTEHFEHTIVVINAGGVIDTKFLRAQKGISAILLMSQPGCVGGLALADVLTGKVTPSGHLTTTWANNYEDYPSFDTFSYQNGDVNDEYYSEGIFVGYRYFDSFGKTPAYPFGFGLSYTDFSIVSKGCSLQGENVILTVTVKNIGNQYSGRETVQVYVTQPQGNLDKAYQVLAGFAKTKSLAPGQEATLEIIFSLRSLASYDEANAHYLLEAGNYYVRLGNYSRNTHIVAAIHVAETIITKQVANKVCKDSDFSTLKANESLFFTYSDEEAEKKSVPIIEVSSQLIPTETVSYESEATLFTTDKETFITLEDVLNYNASVEELTAQLTVEELASLVVGSARGGFAENSIIGAASSACPGAAGDTTSNLIESRGIINLSLADGPAGLRLSKSFVADKDHNIIPGLGESSMGNLPQLLGMPIPERPEDAMDYYQYCTAIPIATLLAQTWDMSLLEEAGDIVGEEMEEFGITLWLAPGMNIHRNPLCGRNFEYYSEDPLISGLCAAADTLGVQAHKGCSTTIKHFALNNQEDNRTHSNSHCSERALREIYLKGFEIAIKIANPKSLMTSYNLVNGIHAANNKELLTDILRQEWNFQGLVMTDWGTTDQPDASFKYGSSSPSLCIKAGNDLIMPGSQNDVDTIINAIGKELTFVDLQTCANRVLSLVVFHQKK
ncbi:glycoside hydrolase family 3 C-terminal domain-containing protein [Anaerobium acetethylicum]|uniref:Beta-glucosidase n=1 Tax=Anaerobium acetethylicum TaxID=1619234 RepID=A0A1D3TX28_9FIRM|nr:glycoside hydrolase family 3 N-terminal domain-containing protein [Anaerobium acetethylicum]SCP98858.1 beta-glucosidase [Anaerobium acetethylicum]